MQAHTSGYYFISQQMDSSEFVSKPARCNTLDASDSDMPKICTQNDLLTDQV